MTAVKQPAHKDTDSIRYDEFLVQIRDLCDRGILKNAYDFLKVIYSESNRLANLIDDILNLSKIESGKLRLELKPCSVGFVINNIVYEFKKQVAQIREKIIQIS